jgi:hypothetical protein
MSGERKNVAVDIVDYNPKKYGDFRYLKLREVTEDDVLFVVYDTTGKIYYEKIHKKPTSKGGRSNQLNSISKRVDKVRGSGVKGSITTLEIDSKSKNLDNYFNLYNLGKLYNEYKEEIKQAKDKEFDEKFKLDHRMKEGETYYIYYPTRGDISEPKSFVANTFNSLDN